MSLTAALIVRNEESTLSSCLESVRDAVDRIVVVDTGSQDRTRDIAREYGADVYRFAWRHDFAAARQFSFDCASGGWIFWFDADDVVVNAAAIRETTEAATPEVDGFYWKYVVGEDEYGNATCELWRERCVRNDGRFRWYGRVHEVLLCRASPVLLRDDRVTVLHRSHGTRPGRDPRRNLDILEDEYEATKTSPEPRLLLYLGNEYADHGRPELGVDFLQRYVSLSTWSDEKYLAQIRIAALLRHRRSYDAAIDAALQALKTHPRWPHAYFSLGETYYFLQDWPKVIHWIEAGQQFPMPDTLCVLNRLECQYDWIIYYTNALFHAGQTREALAWSKRALAIRPGDVWHLENVKAFEAMESCRDAELL